MDIIKPGPQTEEKDIVHSESRRRFFKLAGGIAGAGVLLSACHPTSGPTDIYLGTGDQALLNFLYIIQQVEAAFYTQAVATPYYNITHLEYLALQDVRDQEITHREFLKTLLAEKAVTKISPDFSSVTFADRTSLMNSAAAIEDLAVSALNGSLHLFANTAYAFTFSKMVSVEARHSAYFRDSVVPNSFGTTVVDVQGRDQAQSPSVVMASVQKYTHTRFDSSNLPK